MLGVAGFVESAPSVLAADRLDQSITFPGTSIGAQNARGDFDGRILEIEVDLFCERRSTPRSVSVASSAGTMRSDG